LRQDRIVEVNGVTLECAVYGSGDPVVLLANAGCSVGYLDDLARTFVASRFQAICINMRGVGRSCGSLDDATLHDLAADVAGAIDVLGCGPAHLIGHAFGNRIARCLAADCPSSVRKVVVLAAGGLIAPSPPLGAAFRKASEVKMNGSDCVMKLGVRWLSPASDPRILAAVECWPAVLRISRHPEMYRSTSGGAEGQPPFWSYRGSMIRPLCLATVMRCGSSWASGCEWSICLMPDTSWCWNAPKL